MAATYPSAAKGFATRVNLTQIDALHVNELQDEIMAVESDLLAAWQTRPFDATHYSAPTGAGTWTVEAGDIVSFGWKKIGRTVHIVFDLNPTATSAAMGGELRIALPPGVVIARPALGWLFFNDGAWGQGTVHALTPGDTFLRCFKTGNALWPGNLTALVVRGSITLESQT
jgi:hypothetical protein